MFVLVEYTLVWFKFSCQMLCFCAQWLYLSVLHRLLKPPRLSTRQLACRVVWKERSLISFWIHSSMICWRPRTCFESTASWDGDRFSFQISFGMRNLLWRFILYAGTWLDIDLTNQSPDWRQLAKSGDKWMLLIFRMVVQQKHWNMLTGLGDFNWSLLYTQINLNCTVHCNF